MKSKLVRAAIAGILCGFVGGRVADQCSPAPQSSPLSIPAAVIDSGFHAALDAHGNLYVLDLPYSEMNDSQRDDANRFSQLYPEGKE